MSEHDWTDSYKVLWDNLVPQSGQADTVQGELIRCIGKVTDEAYRNGNENWDRNFELMVMFVGDTLDDTRVFSSDDIEKIRNAVADILNNYESPDLSGRDSSYYYLTEKSVEWCLNSVELMQREINNDLQK